MKRSFYIRPVWDDEAKVFYSDTDISGLNIETDTLEEFYELVAEYAPDMIEANHPLPVAPSKPVQPDTVFVEKAMAVAC